MDTGIKKRKISGKNFSIKKKATENFCVGQESTHTVVFFNFENFGFGNFTFKLSFFRLTQAKKCRF
jgi:hypothetical protein